MPRKQQPKLPPLREPITSPTRETERFTLWMDTNKMMQLRKAAKKENVTVASLVRRAVNVYLGEE